MKSFMLRLREKMKRATTQHDNGLYLEDTPEIAPQGDVNPIEQGRFKHRQKSRQQSIARDGMSVEYASAADKRVRRPWSVKRKVVVSILAVLLVALLGTGAYAYTIFQNPMGQFDNVAKQIVVMPTDQLSLSEGNTASAEMTASAPPTPDEYERLVAGADMSMLKNIVNVLLIGVDHAVERETWNGKKAFHADVMLVLAINTDTGTVDMISLPRDTYAQIPGVKGRYKLNASIDCGGGWPTEGGFNKVCEAAEWMLGGIPVDYYYAVDMNAVKGLADSVGGVDYDVDVDFKMQGRSYSKGMQHMNGQGVLDYLRVRKELGDLSGDDNRVDRQKRMLVAIFEKLKQSNMLVNIPDILDAFDGNLYTNTSLPQTAGLAAFAYNVDPKNIRVHSMGGQQRLVYNWSFCLTDQKARVSLIKEVYGVDVPIYEDFTANAIISKWNSLEGGAVRRSAKSVLAKVKAKLDADAKLPIYGEPTPTPAPTTTTEPPKTEPPKTEPPTTEPPKTEPPPEPPTTAAPSPPEEPSTTAAPPPSEEPPKSGTEAVRGVITPLSLRIIALKTGAPSGYQQYTAAERSFYNHVRATVNSASVEQLKANISKLCSMFGVGAPGYRINWEKDNEIDVDFR